MMSKPIQLIALPLVFLAASPAAATGQTALEQEVLSVLQDYVRATNEGDIEGLAALYLDSPTTGSIGDGSIYRGWASVADLIRGIYGQLGWVELRETDVVVTPLGPNAAVAYFIADWRIGSVPPTRYRGAATFVLTRTSEGWRIAHDHTSTLPGSIVVEAAPPPSSRATPSFVGGGPLGPVREPEACVVVRVVDGDTIECEPFGRVRLIGIDSPEAGQQPFYAMAREFLEDLSPVGTEVLLEPDVDAVDPYGRRLGHIWMQETLVNWVMVRQGFAVLFTVPPNVQYVDWLADAQTAAREESLGLWAVDGFACPPVDFRREICR